MMAKAPEYFDQATIERLGRSASGGAVQLARRVLLRLHHCHVHDDERILIGGFNIVLPPIADALEIPASSRTGPPE